MSHDARDDDEATRMMSRDLPGFAGLPGAHTQAIDEADLEDIEEDEDATRPFSRAALKRKTGKTPAARAVGAQAPQATGAPHVRGAHAERTTDTVTLPVRSAFSAYSEDDAAEATVPRTPLPVAIPPKTPLPVAIPHATPLPAASTHAAPMPAVIAPTTPMPSAIPPATAIPAALPLPVAIPSATPLPISPRPATLPLGIAPAGPGAPPASVRPPSPASVRPAAPRSTADPQPLKLRSPPVFVAVMWICTLLTITGLALLGYLKWKHLW